MTVQITCKGHPNIRASHAKTFEITTDPSISQTGTCIIGVESEYDEDQLLALRGRVKVTLQCDGFEDIVLARINPSFRRGDPLIFRRNDKIQPRTFCLSASKGSSQLNRDLINALQKENAELTIDIEALQKDEDVDKGVVYVVGMPIGDQADISLRALDTLQSVDAILAEDTRTARTMLAEFGITGEFISYHDHNERDRTPKIIERLIAGQRLALVSEAGMPLISDPGFHIISEAVKHNIEVCPVPGPDAVTTALSLSGISPADFRFIGFLPRKTGARKKLFEQFMDAAHAFVFFESPHRIVESLNDLEQILGKDRFVAVCRDLTKHTQHIYRGTPCEVSNEMSQEDRPRGELTVVVKGAEQKDVSETVEMDMDGQKLIEALLKEGCPTKLLASAITQITGQKKRDVFNHIIDLKEKLQD